MNIRRLREHLQTAVDIEWSVIPPYLCARWSLEDGHNELAASCIDDVVMEEMLHLTLACNILNAIGGSPRFIPRDGGSPPQYPCHLPHSDTAYVVNLMPFSPGALDTFLRIERPPPVGAPPEADHYHSIAQFYEAVAQALDQLAEEGYIFTGKATKQVSGAEYYGGGGEAFPIDSLDDATKALNTIVFEGEGINESIWDGDHDLFGESDELAHYFRFNELYLGRRYVPGDTPTSGPSGPPILVDYDSVLPMKPNPRAEDYPVGSDLREMTDECNATYSTLLTQLESAFNGNPGELREAVQTMIRLRYQAIALMRVPLGDGQTAGPPFQWTG